MKLSTCRHCGATLTQGALGCLGCGRLVDEHETVETGAVVQTQLGTQVRDALLDSRWRLVQPLGRGKKATTWLAHDVPFDRKVVVKLLDASLVGNEAEVARFEKNARRLAGLEHKNVIAVLALGRHQGAPFVAMRQAEGRSLAEHVHARGGKLAPGEAAAIVSQLCEAFEAVHQAGGPQGGLQPRAIFVSPDDSRVTLLDVRAEVEPAAADATEATARLTERLEWVAPEVLTGAPVSLRSDVFTLGCVAWELLCGAPPPRGPLEELLAGRGTAIPEPRPGGATLSADLTAAIARATHLDAAVRFGTANELREALASTVALFRPVARRRRTDEQVLAVAVPPQWAPSPVPIAPVREADTTPNQAMPALEHEPDAALKAPPQAVEPLPREDDTTPSRALQGAQLEQPPRRPSRELPLPPRPSPRERSTRHLSAAERARLHENNPALRRSRRNAAIAAALFAVLVFGLYVGLSWDRTPIGPPPPQQMARPVNVAVAEPEPLAKEKPLTVDDVTAPVSVQERHEAFAREYTDEAGKGARRARVKPRVRPPLVADYFGMEKMGELQVRVLYGGEQVSADVTIDGQLIGPSPVYRPLKPGPHTISLERRPMEPVKVPVNVVSGKSMRLEIELVPLE